MSNCEWCNTEMEDEDGVYIEDGDYRICDKCAETAAGRRELAYQEEDAHTRGEWPFRPTDEELGR